MKEQGFLVACLTAAGAIKRVLRLGVFFDDGPATWPW